MTVNVDRCTVYKLEYLSRVSTYLSLDTQVNQEAKTTWLYSCQSK